MPEPGYETGRFSSTPSTFTWMPQCPDGASILRTECQVRVYSLLSSEASYKHFGVSHSVHCNKLPSDGIWCPHCENSTLVHCINREGFARFLVLNRWIFSLNLLLRKRGWFLSAFHIAGLQNVIADALSRNKPMNSEWVLDKTSFM